MAAIAAKCGYNGGGGGGGCGPCGCGTDDEPAGTLDMLVVP